MHYDTLTIITDGVNIRIVDGEEGTIRNDADARAFLQQAIALSMMLPGKIEALLSVNHSTLTHTEKLLQGIIQKHFPQAYREQSADISLGDMAKLNAVMIEFVRELARSGETHVLTPGTGISM